MIRLENMDWLQGTTFIDQVTFQGRDLTGYALRAQGRRNPSAVTELFTATVTLVSASATESVVELRVSALDSSSVEVDELKMDLEIESPTGVVERPVRWEFTNDREITK